MLRIRHSQNVKRATFAPNYGNPWTPELDRQLMVLNQTEPDKVIAERLGRTINSIWRVVRKFEINGRRPTMPVFNTVVQPFTSIMNATLRDERLSLKAHGLLGYMLSMSGEWQFYTAEIAKHFPDGEKAIRSAVNELIAAGYVVKQQPRVSGGRMGETVWNVYGVPDAQNRHAVKSLAPQHSENANADITALSPDSQNRHAVKSPVSQRSENVNADTTALSPDAQNRHAVKSPVPQRSKKTNVDMKAFSPDAVYGTPLRAD